MKDLTFETLLAVFEEVFGRGLFWLMVAAAVFATLGYLYVLIRDRAVSWKKFLYAQLSMPLGALLAVWFVMVMTKSKLSDLGGLSISSSFWASRAWVQSAWRYLSTRLSRFWALCGQSIPPKTESNGT